MKEKTVAAIIEEYTRAGIDETPAAFTMKDYRALKDLATDPAEVAEVAGLAYALGYMRAQAEKRAAE